MLTAYEWGVKHKSCREGLEYRQKLGDKTQADWWKECHRGDWLIWQLRRLPENQLSTVLPSLSRAIDCIATRAIHRALGSIEGNTSEWVDKYRQWVKGWLEGERSTDAARAVAASWAAPWDAARAAAVARAAASSAAWAVDAARASSAARAADAARAAAQAAAGVASRDAARAAAASAARAADAAAVAAQDAAAVAAQDAAWAEELQLQADDIHREIPEWPGDE